MPRIGISLGISGFIKSNFVSSSGGSSGLQPVTAPAGDTNLTTPQGSWTLGTIIFSTNAIPTGTNIIHSGNIYVWTGSGWLNTGNFQSANNTAISGAFIFRNNSGSPYTFWNLSPITVNKTQTANLTAPSGVWKVSNILFGQTMLGRPDKKWRSAS